MRTLVEPPPSSHCDVCGGELRLKQIEPANRTLDLDNEIFVCVKCHREHSCTVSHDHNVRHMPDPKATSANENVFRVLDRLLALLSLCLRCRLIILVSLGHNGFRRRLPA
jgi:hypothetical protein